MSKDDSKKTGDVTYISQACCGHHIGEISANSTCYILVLGGQAKDHLRDLIYFKYPNKDVYDQITLAQFIIGYKWFLVWDEDDRDYIGSYGTRVWMEGHVRN